MPSDAQSKFFKRVFTTGRHLQKDEESIASNGIKEGSRLMLIGRKVRGQEGKGVDI